MLRILYHTQICSDASEKNLTLLHPDLLHYDQKDLRVLFYRTGSISSDKSRLIWIDLDLKKNTAGVTATPLPSDLDQFNWPRWYCGYFLIPYDIVFCYAIQLMIASLTNTQ